ncbi:Hydrolase-like protein [Orpheovirus IHUMI-LCC2]|uniref:Hydrolase-like protein n=1 Tax=Orpheovirus IHUMI-LCC2 TaxID=2023057 RepID=A0A2I2L646_9VIRU|nr:Hydrolase-like protein [Orpheovirus IHUMI-LCC2]SNW62986.1 Hydrolase-like protein [Orpheovirus IHUMI-LCC2]
MADRRLITDETDLHDINIVVVVKDVNKLEEDGFTIDRKIAGSIVCQPPKGYTRKHLVQDDNIIRYQTPTYINKN